MYDIEWEHYSLNKEHGFILPVRRGDKTVLKPEALPLAWLTWR
jgi:hypothetical protein